jgi:hypothetical protein
MADNVIDNLRQVTEEGAKISCRIGGSGNQLQERREWKSVAGEEGADQLQKLNSLWTNK